MLPPDLEVAYKREVRSERVSACFFVGLAFCFIIAEVFRPESRYLWLAVVFWGGMGLVSLFPIVWSRKRRASLENATLVPVTMKFGRSFSSPFTVTICTTDSESSWRCVVRAGRGNRVLSKYLKRTINSEIFFDQAGNSPLAIRIDQEAFFLKHRIRLDNKSGKTDR